MSAKDWLTGTKDFVRELFTRDIAGVERLHVDEDMVRKVFSECLEQSRDMVGVEVREALRRDLNIEERVLELVERLVRTDMGTKMLNRVLEKARQKNVTPSRCGAKPKIAYEIEPY